MRPCDEFRGSGAKIAKLGQIGSRPRDRPLRRMEPDEDTDDRTTPSIVCHSSGGIPAALVPGLILEPHRPPECLICGGVSRHTQRCKSVLTVWSFLGQRRPRATCRNHAHARPNAAPETAACPPRARCRGMQPDGPLGVGSTGSSQQVDRGGTAAERTKVRRRGALGSLLRNWR